MSSPHQQTKVSMPSDTQVVDEDNTPTNKTVQTKDDMPSNTQVVDEDNTPTTKTNMSPDTQDVDEDKTPTNKTVQIKVNMPSDTQDVDEDKTPTNKKVLGEENKPSDTQDVDVDETPTNKKVHGEEKMPSNKKVAFSSLKPEVSSDEEDDMSSDDWDDMSSDDEDNAPSDKKKKKKKKPFMIFGTPDLDQSKGEEWENAKHILPIKHVRFDDKNQYKSPPQSVVSFPALMTSQQDPSEIAKSVAAQNTIAQDARPQNASMLPIGEPIAHQPSQENAAATALIPQAHRPSTSILPAPVPIAHQAAQQNPPATAVVPKAHTPNTSILPAPVPIAHQADQQNPPATAVVSQAHPPNTSILQAPVPIAHQAIQQNPPATAVVPQAQPLNARILPARVPVAPEVGHQTTAMAPATNAPAHNTHPLKAHPPDARDLPARVPIPQQALSTRTRLPPSSIEIPIPYRDNTAVGKGLHNPKLVAARALHQKAKKECSADNTKPHPLLTTKISPKTPSTVAGSIHHVLHSSMNRMSVLWSDLTGSSKPQATWDEMRTEPVIQMPVAPPPSMADEEEYKNPSGDLVNPIGPRRLREPKGVNAFGEPVAVTLNKRPKLVLSQEDHEMYRAARMALQNYHSARPYPKEANYWLCEMCDRFEELHEEMVVLQALLDDELEARIETLAIMNDERESLADAETKVKTLTYEIKAKTCEIKEKTNEIQEYEMSKLSMLHHINQMQQYICFLERKVQSIPSSSDAAFTLHYDLGKRRPTFPCMDDFNMLAALKKEEDIQAEANEYVRMFAENLNNIQHLRLAQTPKEEVPTVRREIECVRIPHAAVKVANWFIQNKDKAVEDITHEIEELLIKTCRTFTISENVWEEYGNMHNSTASIIVEHNVDSMTDVKFEDAENTKRDDAAKTTQLEDTSKVKVNDTPQTEIDNPAEIKQDVPTNSNSDAKTKNRAETGEDGLKGKAKEKAIKPSPIPFDNKTCFIDNFEIQQAAANKTTQLLEVVKQAANQQSHRARSPPNEDTTGKEDCHTVEDDDAWEDEEDDDVDVEDTAGHEDHRSAPDNEPPEEAEVAESESIGSDSDSEGSENSHSNLDIYESFFPGGLTWPSMGHTRLEAVKETYKKKFADDKKAAANPPVELPKLTMGMASERNVIHQPKHVEHRVGAVPPFRYIETPHQRAFRTGGTNISEAQLYKDVFGHSMPKKEWTAEEIKKMENFDYIETERDQLWRGQQMVATKAGEDLAETRIGYSRKVKLSKGIYLNTKEEKYAFLQEATNENFHNRKAARREKRRVRKRQVGRRRSFQKDGEPGLLTEAEIEEITRGRRFSTSWIHEFPGKHESGPSLFTRTATPMTFGKRAITKTPRANSAPAPTATPKEASKEAPKPELKEEEEVPQNKPEASGEGRTEEKTGVNLAWWFAYGNQREN